MTLELILLISFVGMGLTSTLMDSDKGIMAQFRDSGPILAARMERKMATGVCFSVQKGGVGPGPCQSGILYESASPKK